MKLLLFIVVALCGAQLATAQQADYTNTTMYPCGEGCNVCVDVDVSLNTTACTDCMPGYTLDSYTNECNKICASDFTVCATAYTGLDYLDCIFSDVAESCATYYYDNCYYAGTYSGDYCYASSFDMGTCGLSVTALCKTDLAVAAVGANDDVCEVCNGVGSYSTSCVTSASVFPYFECTCASGYSGTLCDINEGSWSGSANTLSASVSAVAVVAAIAAIVA